jgi:hypothetical protein
MSSAEEGREEKFSSRRTSTRGSTSGHERQRASSKCSRKASSASIVQPPGAKSDEMEIDYISHSPHSEAVEDINAGRSPRAQKGSKPKSTSEVDLSMTRNKEGATEVQLRTGVKVPAYMLDGDTRTAPSTKEVWHADCPPFFSFGDTAYTAMLASSQIDEDLARGKLELELYCSIIILNNSRRKGNGRNIRAIPNVNFGCARPQQ